MSKPTSIWRRHFAGLLAGAVIASSAVTALWGTQAAQAVTLPEDPPTVTAEALPTWQLNGVVWSTVVVGDTAYATGEFSKARPPGEPVNSPLAVDAKNIFAFDVTTGEPVDFDHSLNGQGLIVRADDEGTRLYVAGDFTAVNNVPRGHIAAFDLTQPGAPLTDFDARTDGQVRGIVTIDDQVYAGGNFRSSNGQPRRLFAAYQAETGNLRPWAPTGGSSGFVWSLVASPDKSRLIAGGSFTEINGTSAYGMGAIDASTGESLPWAANQRLRAAGANGAIIGLSTDGESIFGAGYAFGNGATFEGTFSADPSTGAINWMNDCLGDTYDSFPMDGVLYTVGHEHDCTQVGSFPDTNPRVRWQNASAERIGPTIGTYTTTDAYGWNFTGIDYTGLLHWYPTLAFGNYTSANQAAWTVGGNGDYLVLAGEFPRVNGVAQQGLVRFAKRGVATSAKPVISGDSVPAPTPIGDGKVRVVFNAMYDRDDPTLLYDVYRTNGSTRVATITRAAATFWNTPSLTFVDEGLAPGTQVRYQIRGRDADGNFQWSSWSGYVTVAGGAGSAYAAGVADLGATHHWRLGDAANAARLIDEIGDSHGTSTSGITRNIAGALNGDADRAVTSTGSGRILTSTEDAAPTSATIEAWVKTTSSRGGRILGIGSQPTATSIETDLVLYLDNSGRANFATRGGDGARRTITTRNGIRDGAWHHVVGSIGPDGMQLYVDGIRQSRDQRYTEASGMSGFWRIGSDTTVGFVNRPSDTALAGQLDEIAVYPRALSLAEVQGRYVASGRTGSWGTRASDTYGSAVVADSPDLYWRLGESSGAMQDSSGSGNHGNVSGSLTRRQSGPVAGSYAATFNGSNAVVVAQQPWTGPGPFTAEIWFKTTTTRGGKLIGFGNATSGLSASYDRHIWMLNTGQLAFGTYAGGQQTLTSSGSYNDNQWHHVAATQGPSGMRLYIDGALVGSNALAAADSYVGYWRIGGDRVWSGATSNYLAGQLAEAAVYPSALSADAVLAHFVAAGGAAPNRPPTAAFTTARDLLQISVDGSGSADPDGPLASYEWSFGDGGTASGPTATHTYAEPGTYQVSLTVTDPEGLSDTRVDEVTVSANQAPAASFEAVVTGYDLAVDAGASEDPDGEIVSYEWSFGDGATGSGEASTHTYAEPGTYTVALTVTDDRGATHTASRDVTVEPVTGPAAADEFGRSVSGGWGTADTGGAWTIVNGPARFSVADGTGKITLVNAGSGVTARLDAVSLTDADLSFDVHVDKEATGSGNYVYVLGRSIPGVGFYSAKIRVLNTGAVQLILLKTLGTTETNLASTTVPAFAAGETLRVRMHTVGTDDTSLRLKVWTGDTEPASWSLSATDATAALQAPGGVGLGAYVSGSSTNLPIVFSFDHLLLPGA